MPLAILAKFELQAVHAVTVPAVTQIIGPLPAPGRIVALAHVPSHLRCDRNLFDLNVSGNAGPSYSCPCQQTMIFKLFRVVDSFALRLLVPTEPAVSISTAWGTTISLAVASVS